MRLTSLFVAGLALSVAGTAFARDGEHRFTHEGYTYVYSTANESGRTVISGRQLPSGEPFRLVVDGERVTGTTGRQSVSFRTASARGAAGRVQVAVN